LLKSGIHRGANGQLAAAGKWKKSKLALAKCSGQRQMGLFIKASSTNILLSVAKKSIFLPSKIGL
jgi:hypothetical protein